MKIDFKKESDGVWRAYVKSFKSHFDGTPDEEIGLFGDLYDHIWVPVATSRNKSLCIRNAKNAISKHFIKNYN